MCERLDLGKEKLMVVGI